MKLHSYKFGSLQDARSVLVQGKAEGLSIDEMIAEIDAIAPQAVSVRRPIKPRPEDICPSCGRFVMIKPKGTSEPVLVCPRCHYSEYGR